MLADGPVDPRQGASPEPAATSAPGQGDDTHGVVPLPLIRSGERTQLAPEALELVVFDCQYGQQ